MLRLRGASVRSASPVWLCSLNALATSPLLLHGTCSIKVDGDETQCRFVEMHSHVCQSLPSSQGHSPGVQFPRVLGIEAAGVVEEAPGKEFAKVRQRARQNPKP